MTLQEAGMFGDVITSVATVATLAYLAVQIRTANVMNVAESRRSVHNLTGDISSLIGPREFAHHIGLLQKIRNKL